MVQTTPKAVQRDLQMLDRFGARKRVAIKQEEDILYLGTHDDDGNTAIIEHPLTDLSKPIMEELEFKGGFYESIMALSGEEESESGERKEVTLDMFVERVGNHAKLEIRTSSEKILLTPSLEETTMTFNPPRYTDREVLMYQGKDEIEPLLKALMAVETQLGARTTANAYLSKNRIITFSTNEIAIYRDAFVRNECTVYDKDGNFAIADFPKDMLDIFIDLKDFTISYAGNFTVVRSGPLTVYVRNMAEKINTSTMDFVDKRLAIGNNPVEIVVDKERLAKALRVISIAQPDSSLGAEKTSFLLYNFELLLFWANEKSRVLELIKLPERDKIIAAFSIPTSTIARAVKAVGKSPTVTFLWDRGQRILGIKTGNYFNVIGLHTKVACPAELRQEFSVPDVGAEVQFI